MKLVFLTVQSGSEDWLNAAADLYLEKIQHFAKAEIQQLKSNRKGRDQSSAKVDSESQDILDQIKPDDFLVLFDQRGDALSSEDFSKLLQRTMNSGKKRCIFLVGGAFGVNADVKKRADKLVSLSNFVFNHHVAQVVVLEQTYRGLSILKGLPYHNK